MANMGGKAWENALGADARMGGNAWGEKAGGGSETVLFDGTVTLEDNEGEGLIGTVTQGTFSAGDQITLTLNGTTYTGIAEDNGGFVGVLLATDPGELTLVAYEGAIMLTCANNMAQLGENSVKIVVSQPTGTILYSGSPEFVQQSGDDYLSATVNIQIPSTSGRLGLQLDGMDFGFATLAQIYQWETRGTIDAALTQDGTEMFLDGASSGTHSVIVRYVQYGAPMQILQCPLAYYDEQRRIFCDVTHTPCGHVFLCQLTMKWKQTDKAADCPLRRKKNETA